jgi:hypothetical protein
MTTQPGRSRRAALVLCLGALVAACGGAAATTPNAPSLAPAAAASTGPSAAPDATMAGPTTFAAWNERQGFGGGAGVLEIQKGAHWLQENPVAPDRAQWADWWSATVDALALWLDVHPATPCWATFHDTARQALTRIQGDFVLIRAAVSKDQLVPQDAAGDMITAADSLGALQPGSSCP